MKHLWKYSVLLAVVFLWMVSDTDLAFASPSLEELNPNEYKDKQFKDNTEYIHNDPLLEKREHLPEEQKLLDFLPKNYDANEEMKKQLFQEGFEEHKTTAYESTKLLLFTNSEKEVKTEDIKSRSLVNTKGIKTFYIGLLLGLLFLTFLILLPRFIRGTKEST
ncbi:type VII secretion protein EssA [Lysinibacillus odysseyi]|nr:type VII secretion protein EssA [Lysinibacillus odysseyi]